MPVMAAHSRRLPVAQVTTALPGRTNDSELSSRSNRGINRPRYRSEAASLPAHDDRPSRWLSRRISVKISKVPDAPSRAISSSTAR